MFRLFKAELRKIFLKPSIFVVTGLIILLLALSTFIYNPQTKSLSFNINYDNCNTVSAAYSKFMGGETYSKSHCDLILSNAKDYISYYIDGIGGVPTKTELVNYYNEIKSYSKAYQQAFANYKNTKEKNPSALNDSKIQLDDKREKLFNVLDNFYEYYCLKANSEKITILVTDEVNFKIKNYYTTYEKANYTHYLNTLDYEGANEAYLNKLIPSQNNFEVFEVLKPLIDQVVDFDVDSEYAESLKQYINTAETRLIDSVNGLYKQITDKYELYSKTSTDNSNLANVKEIIKLITDYNIVTDQAANIVMDSIKLNALYKIGNPNIQQYPTFKDSTIYEMQERLVRNTALFDQEKYPYEYADVFSIGQPSNEHINGFDYSYFALRLCTLFIIVYVVVLAAGTIAGEQSSGTMKLLAIRPFNRNKLLTGKLLATLTIGAILLCVCSIATLVIGGITYGFASLPVLMVFNAEAAVVINPIWLYLIALITMFIEIAFYALVSIFISTVFKSNIGAVTVSILIFFVSLVLNIVATNAPWLRFLPFTNINLFKYFGASFLSTNNVANVLQGILTPTVLVGASFVLSAIFTFVTMAIFAIVSYVKFKKQDIK